MDDPRCAGSAGGGDGVAAGTVVGAAVRCKCGGFGVLCMVVVHVSCAGVSGDVLPAVDVVMLSLFALLRVVLSCR
jgi:hypothetical protein